VSDNHAADVAAGTSDGDVHGELLGKWRKIIGEG